MTFEVVWSQSAIKQLKKLDRSVAKRIASAVDKLHLDPHRFVSRIVNSPYFRLRVGDYRLMVDIQRKELRVLLLKVGHRKGIYDRDIG